MNPKAENMTEWFKRKSSGGTSVSRLSLAAFGKHPGWDDHIPGIGVDTEALANLKQTLYFDGIRGQIDAGAWEKMEQLKRMEGFDHLFLWLRPGRVFLGMMWSSSDRIGRAKYPMILCAEGEGFSPAFMLAHAKPELERLRDTCKSLTSAEEVTSECRLALDRLRGTFERAQDAWTEPFSDTERKGLLDCPELAPDRIGFLRILHEYSTEQGIASEKSTKHLRVPVISSLQPDNFTPWVEFFRCIVPSKTPALFIKRNDQAWLDVVVGEPASRDFFCLQAATDALPLTTQVPYEISADTRSALDAVAARLGLSAPPVRQSKPRAPVAPIAGVPAGSKGGGRLLILIGIIVIVVLVGVALALLLKPNNPPPKSAAAPVNNAATPVATDSAKYGTAIQSATDAFAKGDYDEAIRQANIALDCQPGDQAATQIKADAVNKKRDGELQDRTYAAAMTAGRNALAAGNYDEAGRQIRNALADKPGDSDAMTLYATIESRQQADAKTRQDQHEQEQRQNYNVAMQAARQAFDGKNYSLAIQHANDALTAEPGDADAGALKTKAENAQASGQAGNATSDGSSQKKSQQYQSEISAVQAAWTRNDFDAVIQHANLALQLAPDAPDIKSRLRDSVYNKLEIYAVWFGVIKPQDATFQLAKTQSPLAQGNMAPSAADAYKNQIDGWLKILKQYQLVDDAHTKLAQAIEESIDHY